MSDHLINDDVALGESRALSCFPRNGNELHPKTEHVKKALEGEEENKEVTTGT